MIPALYQIEVEGIRREYFGVTTDLNICWWNHIDSIQRNIHRQKEFNFLLDKVEEISINLRVIGLGGIYSRNQLLQTFIESVETNPHVKRLIVNGRDLDIAVEDLKFGLSDHEKASLYQMPITPDEDEIEWIKTHMKVVLQKGDAEFQFKHFPWYREPLDFGAGYSKYLRSRDFESRYRKEKTLFKSWETQPPSKIIVSKVF